MFNSKYLRSIEECAEQTATELKSDYDRQMARWIKQGQQGMQPQLYNLRGASSRNLYYLRLAADFPVIPKLHDNPEWTFQAEEVYGMDWDNLPADSLYSQHLDEIIESSTKIEKLGEIFREMDKRSVNALANGGRKDKMILTTAHPVALFLLDQAIKRKHPQYRVVKVTAPMGQAKRTEIFNGFCDKESKSQDKYKDYDILLTTTPLVGTGLNMTDPNVFVMLDPLWMQRDQRQAFARIHRAGQLRETYLILMYSIRNPVEHWILERQRKCQNIGDMAWMVTTGDLEVEQQREAKRVQRRAEKGSWMAVV